MLTLAIIFIALIVLTLLDAADRRRDPDSEQPR